MMIMNSYFIRDFLQGASIEYYTVPGNQYSLHLVFLTILQRKHSDPSFIDNEDVAQGN